MSITETKDGIIIEVFTKPNSRIFKILVDKDEIVVFSTQEPVKGKVNKEVIQKFSKLLQSKAEIISGLTSKQKKLLISGLKKKEAEQILRQMSF
jgi:uncharacterized protein (TIGR00251 family)